MYQKINLYSKNNNVVRIIDDDKTFICKKFSNYKNILKETEVLTILKKSDIEVPRILKKDNLGLFLEDLGDLTLLRWFENSELQNSNDYYDIIIKLSNWLKRFYSVTKEYYKKTYILGDVNFRNFIIKGDEIFGIDFEHSGYGNIETDIGKLAAFALMYDPQLTDWKIRFRDNLIKTLSYELSSDMNLIMLEEQKELTAIKKRRKSWRC